jgi:dihydrofolate reductase
VVTTTLGRLAWLNSTAIVAHVAEDVAGIKAQPGNELQVHGSGQLVRFLMAHELIDEYRLLIYPVVLGAGRRLFDDPNLASALQLVDTKTTISGVTVVTYLPAGKLRHGSFASDPEPDRHRILR